MPPTNAEKNTSTQSTWPHDAQQRRLVTSVLPKQIKTENKESSRRTKQSTRYDKKETATSRSRKRTNACRFLKQVCHA
ncbi:hypothetical protein BDL97_05G116300 [Sphagnum fallax]|nr:hypothetical protein BDL97_05G116300 [Sphagnum fallax]